MKDITTIGLNLAKQVFQVHGANAHGAPLFNRKLRRAEVLRFFEKLPPCLDHEVRPGQDGRAAGSRDGAQDVWICSSAREPRRSTPCALIWASWASLLQSGSPMSRHWPSSSGMKPMPAWRSAARFALTEMVDQIELVAARIERLEREIVVQAGRDADMRRLSRL